MIRRDPLFKGCTRPAMLWGVPLAPFLAVMGVLLLLAMWLSLLIALLMLPAYFLMRYVVRNDEQQFRLLALKFLCRVMRRDANHRFWKASAYAPVSFTKRK